MFLIANLLTIYPNSQKDRKSACTKYCLAKGDRKQKDKKKGRRKGCSGDHSISGTDRYVHYIIHTHVYIIGDALIDIGFGNIILDVLHLMLRVCGYNLVQMIYIAETYGYASVSVCVGVTICQLSGVVL